MKTRLFSFGPLAAILLLAMTMLPQSIVAKGVYLSPDDIGKVVCVDGSIYATVSEATADGKTAVAMIAYINQDKQKGLAIALEDASAEVINHCPPAIELAQTYNTTHAVEWGTWRLPSVADWENMFIGCGSTSTFIDPLPDSASSYEMDDYEFSYGDIRTMIVAAGGTDFVHETNEFGYWTTTTPITVGGDIRWAFFFSLLTTTSNSTYSAFDMEVKGLVRPCIEFTAYVNAHNLTIKEGTEDAEFWTIDPNPAPENKVTVLTYSGNKVVKSVTLAKSGAEGYSPHSFYLRRYDWWVTMPEYDDEVVIEYDESYNIIADNEDNSAKLEALDGTTTDVIISAKLQQGWNILTLPFDLPGGFDSKLGLSAKAFVGSSYEGGTSAAFGPTLKLYFDDVTDLEAGKPYLVKAEVDRDLFNYPFQNVTVKKTGQTVSSKYADFIPTLSQGTISDDPLTVLFLYGPASITTEPPYVLFYPPHPYYPEMPAGINGLCGYLWLTQEAKNVYSEEMAFEIVFGPYVPDQTRIGKVHNEIQGKGEIYNLNGQGVNMIDKGPYIIDGRKVLIK